MNSFKRVHDLCVKRQVSVATAESCTSGFISLNLSKNSGSSIFFKGGIIAYHNEIKIKVLGVDKLDINQFTEVSSEVAGQMAKGVRRFFSVDYAIATSGYAGPNGGSVNNPVGTVFIAISSVSGIFVNRFTFSGDRQEVIRQTSDKSASLLYNYIKKH